MKPWTAHTLLPRMYYPALLLPVVVQAGAAITIREIPMGRLEPQPFRAIVNEVVRVSPDCRHVAFAAEQGDQTRVYVDGIAGKLYDDAGAVAFSPRGNHVAYVASESNQWFVVCDGREGRRYPEIMGTVWKGRWPFLFSPNGERIAYVATDGQSQRVLVDSQEIEPYDEVLAGTPIFSTDSRRFAYAARRADRIIAVVDGKPVASADGIAVMYKSVVGLSFSPNSQRVALTLQRAGKWVVVVDGVESRPCDEVLQEFGLGLARGVNGGVQFSPDSKHFAYIARRDGIESLVLDGEEKAKAKYIGGLLFSPDGKRTAYVRLDDAQGAHCDTSVVLDGVAGKPFDGLVEQMCFSPDSSQLVYVAKRGHVLALGGEFVVINGEASRDYESVGDISWDPVISNPAGGRLAYVATRPRSSRKALGWLESITGRDLGSDREISYLVVGGRERKLAETFERTMCSFSPNGKRWGYFLDKAKDLQSTDHDQVVVVDGKRIGLYGPDNCSWNKIIRFSPDSRHFAFEAFKGSWRGVLVVDGVEQDIRGEWLIGSHLVFDSPTHLHGLIMRDQKFIRLEVDVAPALSAERTGEAR